MISRPPDSTSMVASILAVAMGGRCGTTMTEVNSRRRDVQPAMKASVVSWSKQ
jgi:hypothetical protein